MELDILCDFLIVICAKKMLTKWCLHGVNEITGKNFFECQYQEPIQVFRFIERMYQIFRLQI